MSRSKAQCTHDAYIYYLKEVKSTLIDPSSSYSTFGKLSSDPRFSMPLAPFSSANLMSLSMPGIAMSPKI